MDHRDAARAERPEQLRRDPGLPLLTKLGIAAAEIEQRRQPLGRKPAEPFTQPACLGGKNAGLLRSVALTHHR
jgi:hypothetical protein